MTEQRKSLLGWRRGGAAYQPQLRDRPALTPLLAVGDVHCGKRFAGQSQVQPISLPYQSIIASSGLSVEQGAEPKPVKVSSLTWKKLHNFAMG